MVLKIEKICKKSNDVWRNKDISFSCSSGQVIGLVGNNGAGKTTLLNILAGHNKADSGNVVYINEASKPEKLMGKIGACINLDSGYKNMTAREMMEYIALIHGNISEGKIEELLNKLNINTPKKFEKYSLGMRVRLNLAMTLLKEPEVLILDEVFNGLDPKGQRELKRIIIDYAKRNQRIVIISSHNLDDVEEISDKVLIMKEGQLVCEVNEEEMKEKRLQQLFEKYAG